MEALYPRAILALGEGQGLHSRRCRSSNDAKPEPVSCLSDCPIVQLESSNSRMILVYRGAVQAIEDAAALGIIFSNKYRYAQDPQAGLQLYERIRKPRATRVQHASLRATENINERIGFSTQPYTQGKLAATGKLTTDELNLYGA